ncbi:hypothetical protein WG8_0965, partial [Paenibacillus sp. Aloe-11]
FETGLMAFTIVVMIIFVQAIQFTGSTISRRIDKR